MFLVLCAALVSGSFLQIKIAYASDEIDVVMKEIPIQTKASVDLYKIRRHLS